MIPLNNWKQLIIILTIINIPFIVPKALAQDAITIAKQVTVKISEAESNDKGGSGVIIGKKNGKYIIVTNCHVIKNGGSYDIETYVNRTYRINISDPLSFCHPQRTPEQVDLAFLEIPDDYNYPTAKIATGELKLGQKVFVLGFPAKDITATTRVIEFQPGEINRINPESARRGYGLVHSAETLQGMSGGGIFNEQGKLIAISGEARQAQDLRQVWGFYGILVKNYLNWEKMTFDSPTSSPVISSSRPVRDWENNTFDSSTSSPVNSKSTPVMFQKLETLLQAGKWKDADLETWELMKKLTKREKEGQLRLEDYQNFPREELRIMDQLWVKHSNGKFGFSVQKQIWLGLGGDFDGKYLDGNTRSTYMKLCERIGWKKNGGWLSYSEYIFSTDAPAGHLPQVGHVQASFAGRESYLETYLAESFYKRLVGLFYLL
jgi:hypothetical protein